MDALLIATGFTGALTVIYLVRVVWKWLRPPLSVAAFFSPGGGCTDAIVKEIAAAKHEILVLAYGFTSHAIAQALAEAKSRAVDVHIVLDHSNEKEAHTELPFLLEQKLEPLIDTHHAIAHNKVMIIDGKTLITGSFNFTVQAESHNAENLVIVKGHPELVAAYRFDFNHHKAHSRKVEGVAAAETDKEQHRHAAEHHGKESHKPAKDSHADILTAVAHGVAAPADEEDTPIKPTATAAAAELFARLRKEGESDKEHAGKAA
jgi:phosphatidylserine/phosphatidylglycerophosphate/cardiolipin synthase-like enzyme